MLTLHLTLNNNQVSVLVNGKESHQFSLLDLSQTKEEWKGFLDNPRPYGDKLFNALFRDVAKNEFDALSKQTERTIVLVLESPELDGVAWEYAYNKAKEEYVVEDCAFVRALPENERPANGRLKASYERVPLLFIPANPLVDLSGEPMRALDEESEWREITKHITASNAGFDLLKMLPATPEQLQTVMAQFREGLIVHFSGHGAATKDGAILLFERENGASNPLEAREFVREIKDKAAITFLSACQSAVAERTEFSNLARGLVKAGVLFALGMQFNLPDPFAPDISGQFYNYLTRGHGVPEAARQARRAVKREHEFFVGMIALYAAHPDEVGALKWNDTGAKTLSTFRPADVSDLPSPASGLIGRQRELMRIGTQLLEGKKPLTVTLHGAGGIGKTALLWQALLRFAPSFESTLAIALDPLPSLESVLGRIERFLGLPSPCANDTKEREAMARNALTSKRTLLGLDNFETLNHAVQSQESQSQETLESAKVAKILYAFFKSLPAAGATLCVTSREKTNLPGEHIEEIYGLEDAMGGALFYENVSTRKDALNEADLEKLSAAVGGHPLALRLLAPIFEDQAGLSLEQFIEKLQTFLPKTSDQWSEQERHESLGACFAFSMDNLPRNLEISVSRLSVFTAFFFDATAAPVLENNIPESEEEGKKSKTLAQNVLHTLWERGLLERAVIQLENDNIYLYRIHPTLNQFVAERIMPENILLTQGIYFSTINFLVSRAHPASPSGGIYRDPVLATIVWFAMPDILRATKLVLNNDAFTFLFHVAFLCAHFGDTEEAMKLYMQALKNDDDLEDKQGRAALLHNMAHIYVTRGDLDKAIKLYKLSLEICEKAGDKQGISTNLHAMAYILHTHGDLDGAMRLYTQSLEIDKSLGSKGEQGHAATLCKMADIYTERGDLDGAMKLHSQALEISEALGDFNGKSYSLYAMANIYSRHGDINRAINLYVESFKIYRDLGNLQGESNSLHAMARILRMQGNLDSAMKLYIASLEMKEKLGDLPGKSDALCGLADVYVKSGNLDAAMKLYQQSMNIKEGLGDLRGKVDILVAMGQVLWAFHRYSESLQSLLGSLETLLKMGARSDAEKVASIFVALRIGIGSERLDTLWNEITGQNVLDWLTQSDLAASLSPSNGKE